MCVCVCNKVLILWRRKKKGKKTEPLANPAPRRGHPVCVCVLISSGKLLSHNHTPDRQSVRERERDYDLHTINPEQRNSASASCSPPAPPPFLCACDCVRVCVRSIKYLSARTAHPPHHLLPPQNQHSPPTPLSPCVCVPCRIPCDTLQPSPLLPPLRPCSASSPHRRPIGHTRPSSRALHRPPQAGTRRVRLCPQSTDRYIWSAGRVTPAWRNSSIKVSTRFAAHL